MRQPHRKFRVDNTLEFAAWLRRTCVRNGVTYKELAKHLGISHSYAEKWTSGFSRIPPKYVAQIAGFFDLKVSVVERAMRGTNISKSKSSNRICLNCSKKFKSEGAHNRLCAYCSQKLSGEESDYEIEGS